ncbi:MAG: amidase [Rhodospirillaceae bacterium]|jgi:aspartyl-tRNA(Asn)/glutamyl-tRNA(Gln) amidotransferase subunit A|nr:amidase [Rhodospirillaceae bacterium]MBT4940297.1 amidase [Rhodospirillaceae bacterium]MBT7268389.1 amidase [Rhodospirillaceae bacterium]
MSTKQETWDRSASEIALALRDGRTTSTVLTEYAIARHDQLGEKLHAYLTWAPALALKEAQSADQAFAEGRDLGLLQGLPISIKDLYGVQGYPTYGGSAQPLAAKWEQEGPVVQDIKSQLAVITGKTHTVEFAAGGIGDNVHWGAPWNPWDKDNHRGPGGSSSGAGVSLWEGSAIVAFGSDTMGSVRIPASMTGVVGLKITHGRWSEKGIVPLRGVQDTPGPLTRSVADAAFVFAALDAAHRPNPQSFLEQISTADLSGMTFGVADRCFWEGCALNIAEIVQEAIAKLEQAGAKVVDAPSPETVELLSVVMSGGLPNNELVVFLEEEVPNWQEKVDPALRGRLEKGSSQTAIEYIRREQWLAQLRQSAPQNFEHVDVILSPTVPISPPVLIDGKPVPNPDNPPIIGARNTCPANFLEQCALTLPVGLDTDGMPVGLQLIAPANSEEKLLAAASAIERVLGTPMQQIGLPPMVK